MANYEHTKVACDDKKLINKLEEKLVKLGYEVEKDKNTLKTFNKEGVVERILLEITKEHTDVIVEVMTSNEDNWYTRIYHQEFINGKFELVDIEINYMYDGYDILDEMGEKLGQKAKAQIDSFYKKMDSVTETTERFIVDDNSDKEITVVFNIDNFEITTFKKGSAILISDIKRLPDHKNWTRD